jgi:hypothetical protein
MTTNVPFCDSLKGGKRKQKPVLLVEEAEEPVELALLKIPFISLYNLPPKLTNGSASTSVRVYE